MIKKYSLLILLLLFIGLNHTNLYAQFDGIVKNKNAHFIGSNTHFFVDESFKLTINEAWNEYTKGKFESVKTDVFTSPPVHKNYWFQFTLSSEISEDLWLNVNNNILDSVTLYKLDTDGKLVFEHTTGAMLDKSSRLYDCHTYWFPLIEKGDSETYHYFIKVYTSMMVEIPLEVGSFKALIKSKGKSDLLAHIFIGALLIMFIYNVFILIATKDKIYFIYDLYILAVFFGSTYLNNYPLIEYILGPEITYQHMIVWISPVSIFMGLFAIEYLQLKTNLNKWYRVIIFEIGAYLILVLINVFVPLIYLANIHQVFVIIFFTTCLFISYYLMYLGDERAKLYSIGWSALMLSTIGYILVIDGIIPYTIFTRNLIYLGSLTEIIVFSIALAQRINTMKDQQILLNESLETKNEELNNANDSLDSFNYHVSHDLKTVLNNTNVLARMIKKYISKGDTKKLNEISDKLLKVTENGSETVQSFLSLGQVDSIFRLEELILINPSEELKKIINHNNLSDVITLKILKDEIKEMNIHRKAIESIFLNFLTNSIKYTNKPAVAEVEFILRDNSYMLVYKDNGIGIDLEKDGDKLFEPFKRLKNTLNKEGSGVGLYLVKRIITNYRGYIKVESELGKGTKFIVSIPINRETKNYKKF